MSRKNCINYKIFKISHFENSQKVYFGKSASIYEGKKFNKEIVYFVNNDKTWGFGNARTYLINLYFRTHSNQLHIVEEARNKMADLRPFFTIVVFVREAAGN